jgi:hypothetical protein
MFLQSDARSRISVDISRVHEIEPVGAGSDTLPGADLSAR